MTTGEDIDLKVVLLGDSNTGKTCLLHRYLHGTFCESMTTCGASFAAKTVELPHRTSRIGLWDTAGQERFDALSRFYCRGAGAAVVCFDLTDQASFDCVMRRWVKRVRDEAAKGCLLYLVGTKSDLAAERVVSAEVIADLAHKIHADGTFETSSLTGARVTDVFDAVSRDFFCRAAEGEAAAAGGVPIGKPKDGGRSGSCCG